MKKLLTLFIVLPLLQSGLTQSNTFPASGNVGIGTTNPRTTLDLNNTGAVMLKEIHFVAEDIGVGADNSDPYTLRKVHDASNVSHLDLNLNDDADESFRIYGYSCNGYNCGTYSGNLYHLFDASGNAYHAGNLGIGTANPQAKLDIHGNQILRGSGSNSGLRDIAGISYGTDTYTAPFNAIQFRIEGGTQLDDNLAILFKTQSNGTSGERIRITSDGSLAIGTTNPGSFKLAVEGNIGARKVIVTKTNPFPDYVFNDDYKLPTLAQVEQFIKVKKHLPEIPTAKEVEKNGLDIGDNQTKLLQKIEELTLYLIAQQQQIGDLKKENIKQQKEIDTLRKKLININF